MMWYFGVDSVLITLLFKIFLDIERFGWFWGENRVSLLLKN